jgi:hypothetical protein
MLLNQCQDLLDIRTSEKGVSEQFIEIKEWKMAKCYAKRH